MGTVKVFFTEYGTYGKCVAITNGETELFATLDVGPHIIRYGFTGGENVFFEDVERKTAKDMTGTPYSGRDWWGMGGHRLWCSPERFPRTYYPENCAVKCEVKDNTVILTPPVQEWSQIQNQMEITMTADGEVTVFHSVTNKSAWAIELAPWALSMMRAGGMAVVGQNTRDTDFLPNKWVSFWRYTSMNDSRIYLGEKYIALSHENRTDAAKIGLLSEAGVAAFFTGETAFVKTFGFVPRALYPDNGCNCECYTCGLFTELESVGPLTKLEPGSRVGHTERWRLFWAEKPAARDETAIEKAVEPLFKAMKP